MPGRSKSQVGGGIMLTGVLLALAGLTIGSAGASGESTTVTLTSPTSGTSTTFTWSYVFNPNGGHDLSNIALGFCSQAVLAHVVEASPNAEIFLSGDVPGGHAGFGPGIKFAVTAVTGTVSVTFDQAYAIGAGGVLVQSHSGDGQDPDLTTAGSGPPCDPGTTTSSTVAPTTTVVPTTTPIVPTTTTVPVTTTVPTTTTVPVATTIPLVTTTVPATTTTVRVTTTQAPTTTTTTTPPVTAAVLDESFTRSDPPAAVEGGQLARTGSSTLLPLVWFGAVLIAVGACLVVGEYLERPAYED